MHSFDSFIDIVSDIDKRCWFLFEELQLLDNLFSFSVGFDLTNENDAVNGSTITIFHSVLVMGKVVELG